MDATWNWMINHASFVSALGTIFTALIWLVYAHIGIFSILRQRRPRVIIDQTQERTIESKFVVVNLSQQPVYITHIIVVVNHDGDQTSKRLSTYYRGSSKEVHENPLQAQQEINQGTLNPGEIFLLGDTDLLLSWMLTGQEEDPESSHPEKLRQAMSQIETVEIRVISMVGVDDKPIGSSRLFTIDKSDSDVYIRPYFAQTRHLTSWRERRIVDQWTKQEM